MMDRIEVDFGNGTKLVTMTYVFRRLLDAAEDGLRARRLPDDEGTEGFIERCRSNCMALRK